jgi:nitrite reductase/ring-hydroxylating ferredoxin subunit/uncharacterized membrane protein
MSAVERAARAVERATWLDHVAQPVQKGVLAGYAAGGELGRRVKNALHGTWLGHPLHPVLTDVPLGAWTAAAVLDVLRPAGPTPQRGADVAVAVGIAGAVGAALTGLTDWAHTDGRARRTGILHAVLNTAALGLYTASMVARLSGARRTGRALAMVGLGVVGTAAYLGGSLVFWHRIGVRHGPTMDEPREFAAALQDGELREGELRRVEVTGRPVLLARRHGRVRALAETCTHLGGPLAEGTLEGDAVRCPWHGSRFALEDGRVLDGPAAAPQACLEARVRDGWIEVRVAPDEEPG